MYSSTLSLPYLSPINILVSNNNRFVGKEKESVNGARDVDEKIRVPV
jgi:hypothetical protein